MQDVQALVWALERNPSNFTPRASAPQRLNRRLLCWWCQPQGICHGCLLSVGGSRQRAHSDAQTQEQGVDTGYKVVSLGRNSVGNARTGLRSQKGHYQGLVGQALTRSTQNLG